MVFLAVLAGLVGLSIAFYAKAFTPVVRRHARGRHASATSCPPRPTSSCAASSSARSATSPPPATAPRSTWRSTPTRSTSSRTTSRRACCPRRCSARSSSTSSSRRTPTTRPSATGDVIPQDRSETARETEQVLNDLLPLLQALKPAAAEHHAQRPLLGAARPRRPDRREPRAGRRATSRSSTPSWTTLGENFRGSPTSPTTLETATPDLVPLLDNLSAINRNLVDQEQELSTFLTATTTFGRRARRLPAREREAPGPPRRRQPAVARALREVLAGVPLPRPGARRLEQGHRRRASAGCSPACTSRSSSPRTRAATDPRSTSRSYRDDRGPRCYGLPDPEGPGAGHQLPGRLPRRRGRRTPRSASPRVAPRRSPRPPAQDPALALASPRRPARCHGRRRRPRAGRLGRRGAGPRLPAVRPVARGTEVGLR